MSDAAAQRWATFLQKVQARVTELEAEARAGLEGLVETEVLDPVPLGNALSELKARFFNLSRKVDEAWSGTIEPMLEDAPEARWRALWQQGEALRRLIEGTFGQLEREALARHARALHVLVQGEADAAIHCTSCGAPLVKRVRPRAVNVTCQHCRAVTTVRPGLATALFFGGGALHALGVAGAEPQLLAMEAAERTWQALRHPTDADLATFRAAVETYWQAWATEKAKWVPGSSAQTIAQDASIKVSQQLASVEPRERVKRQVHSQALALAEQSDVTGLVTLMKTTAAKAFVSVDDLLECAAEHEAPRALEVMLRAAFRVEAPGDPERAWLAEKRADVTTTVARRRR